MARIKLFLSRALREGMSKSLFDIVAPAFKLSEMANLARGPSHPSDSDE